MFKFQFGKFLTGELTREIEERVMALKYLTPGDFKVVYQKNAFIDEVSVENLICQLEVETGYKKISAKSIGLGC